MRTVRGWSAALACVFAACSSGYDSELLRLQWEPPRGFALVEEQAGPPATARFSSGLELFSIEQDVGNIDEGSLDAVFEAVRRPCGLDSGTPMISARVATLRSKQVARFALGGHDERTLLYLIPSGGRVVALRLKAAARVYPRLESLVERSLGTLRVRK